jgi:hypothetical protein
MDPRSPNPIPRPSGDIPADARENEEYLDRAAQGGERVEEAEAARKEHEEHKGRAEPKKPNILSRLLKRRNTGLWR